MGPRDTTRESHIAQLDAGDFLGRVAAKLDSAGVPHMVVGSFASSFHGIPRFASAWRRPKTR
jgi:hypothetical protein